MTDLAPIALFTYNRLAETKQTLSALKNNYLADKSQLFIFSDGGKNTSDNRKVRQVRDFLHTINGFKNIVILESDENQGLALSILSGVNKIINEYGQVIVLEDDLITSENFLDYMNQSLSFYKNDQNVMSISGYTMDLPSLKNFEKDYYTGFRASSWGWATWDNQWNNIDWDIKDYIQFKSSLKERLAFQKIGSDMPKMLKQQMNGTLDSWAIRWCYHQFKHNLLTVFASKSKIKNIGVGQDATHTHGDTKYITPLDNGEKRCFYFDPNPSINKQLIKEFRSKYSIHSRIYNKIKKIIRNSNFKH